MYVSVPKNYGGVAFSRGQVQKKTEEPKITEEPQHIAPAVCTEGEGERRNPLSRFIGTLKKGEKGGVDVEDFLLLGLIATLYGKSESDDVLLILALLLMI